MNMNSTTTKFSAHLLYISSMSVIVQAVIPEKPSVLGFILADTMLTFIIKSSFPLSSIVLASHLLIKSINLLKSKPPILASGC